MYDVAKWLHERTARFPRNFRFGLGDHLQQESLTLLSALVTASFTRDRAAALRAASLALTRLRVLVRLARDLQCLSTRQYLYIMEPMEEVGRMVGGWSRHAASPAGEPA
jgi:hypothetical protein